MSLKTDAKERKGGEWRRLFGEHSLLEIEFLYTP
jgi:hypothetical protein